jgi:hypothetical protein
VEEDWDRVVALVLVDCDGCEWALLPLLLAHDRALARVHTLDIRLNARRSTFAGGEPALMSLLEAFQSAGFIPLRSVAGEHSRALLTAEVSPARVLFNINLAVEAQLGPWRSIGGIAPEHVQKVPELKRQDGELIQVVNGTVRLFRGQFRAMAKPMLMFRYLQAAWLVQLAVNRSTPASPFPDMEFWVGVEDSVLAQLPNATTPILQSFYFAPDPLAAFTVVSCRDSFSMALPVANLYDGEGPWQTWSELYSRARAAACLHDWKSRKPIAFFRGGLERTCNVGADGGGRGGAPSHAPVDSCGRRLLYNMFKNRSDVADVYGNHLSMEQQERYKYALHAHGHSQWSSRLRLHLAGGRLLLKQLGVCEEFYGAQLQAFVHYVPVDYNWRNLSEAVMWARGNDPEAQKIVLRMNRYSDSVVGSLSVIAEYTRRLLLGYHALLLSKSLVYPIGIPLRDAAELANQTHSKESVGI